METNDCPDRDLLQAYHVGTLPEETAEEVIAHLSQCSTCQIALATLEVAGDSLVARLRQPEVEVYADEPQCHEMVALVMAGSPSMAGHAGARDRSPEKLDDGPSLDVFRRRLAESGLMTAAEVDQFIAGLPKEDRPTTARRLAREMHRQGLITRFQAQAVFEGKTRGLVVGNYAILDKLGEGGMGRVYTAQHRKMKRVVAIKMLPSSATNSPDTVKRFQREVRAAAKLSHPNIVTAFDADEAQGSYFLVMEYVEGRDLSTLVRTGRAAAARPGGRLRHAGGSRTRICPWPGHRPSRHQAIELAARQERHRQDSRHGPGGSRDWTAQSGATMTGLTRERAR